jgi:hypothetical protein
MMAIPGRQRSKGIAGQFAPRTIEMLRSPAYRALSLSGHRVLARLEIELANHGGTDNGKLPVTYDDFESYGMDRHSIAPGIRECVALGFTEVTEPGRAGNAEFRRPTLFRITYRHTGRAAPTDEWQRIKTNEEAEAISLQARNKNKKPVGVLTNSQWRNPHRKRPFHSGGTPTTGVSAFSPTTLESLGGVPHRPPSSRRA